ncbi:MAG: lamin tail domain-containing protein [Candidatus Aenigmarchaeota archaeon]|nr:lamin tail domain-containing protein [Candidatus Aenigmarchaeota archaeon]
MQQLAALLLLVAVSGCTTSVTGDAAAEPRPIEIQVETVIPDPCANVTCAPSLLSCPDGTTARCDNACAAGSCSACTPACANPGCAEDWECTPWSACENGTQQRSCLELNGCGTALAKPGLTQDCFSLAIISVDAAGERAVIRNLGLTAANLQGWTLRDAAGHVFTFQAFILQPGSEVAVVKGTGPDTAATLSWGSNVNVWNNDGDIATLADAEGNVVSELAY